LIYYDLHSAPSPKVPAAVGIAYFPAFLCIRGLRYQPVLWRGIIITAAVMTSPRYPAFLATVDYLLLLRRVRVRRSDARAHAPFGGGGFGIGRTDYVGASL